MLRIGLAFVYLYAAIEIHINPAGFMKYVPSQMSIIPTDLFLLVFGIFEVLLTLWLLSGKRTEYAGMISFLLMAGIIFPNMAYFDVLFRNVAIAFASLALVALDHRKRRMI